MLRNVNDIMGYVLQAKDGEIGRCKDFLFDDEHWTIRYMVADTGKWLPGRKVLISPLSVGELDWSSKLFPVRLNKKQIEEAPGLDEHEPVSRQYEIKYHFHYGWRHYWGETDGGEARTAPQTLHIDKKIEVPSDKDKAGDPHLRAVKEVTGYDIQATDGEIGHVEDFIVDDETWTIRYMLVGTRNWLPGRKVLVAPAWIKSVYWVESKVNVDLTREQIKNSPEYDPTVPVDREYETHLVEFYGLSKYWEYLRTDPQKEKFGSQIPEDES
jgi:hypothetical protein